MSQAEQALISREVLAAEYLSLLKALAAEVEAAMHAITHNALQDFQDRIANQEMLCVSLQRVSRALAIDTECTPEMKSITGDPELATRIRTAHRELTRLNRAYASLVGHAGQSAALFGMLWKSFQHQLRPSGGTGDPSALSCEV